MFAVNEAWAPYMAVAIHSLCRRTNPGCVYHVWVVSDSLGSECRNQLLQTVAAYPHVVLDFKLIPEELLSMLHGLHLRYPGLLAYSRLAAASLFPQYDRMVYLDMDLVVQADVAELFDQPLDGCPLGAVSDMMVWNMQSGAKEPHLERMTLLGMGSPTNYFNSGVLVMDLNAIRLQGYEEQLWQMVREHHQEFNYQDQDAMNLAFGGLWKHLPLEWNYHFTFFVEMADQSASQETEASFLKAAKLYAERSWKVFHFVGAPKPWEYRPKEMTNVLYSDVWWQEAALTPAFRPLLLSVLEECLQNTCWQWRRNVWRLPVSVGTSFVRRIRKIRRLSLLKQVLKRHLKEFQASL